MTNKLTVKDYIEGRYDKSRPVYIHTAIDGYAEVDHIRWPETDPWVVCPKLNGGFGMSFCVHYGTALYQSE